MRCASFGMPAVLGVVGNGRSAGRVRYAKGSFDERTEVVIAATQEPARNALGRGRRWQASVADLSTVTGIVAISPPLRFRTHMDETLLVELPRSGSNYATFATRTTRACRNAAKTAALSAPRSLGEMPN